MKMRAYNAATVLKLSSRPVLAAFFEHERCMKNVEFNKARLHEIQEAFGALPEKVRHRIEPTMRKVFDFAHSELSMLTLVDEIMKYHNTDDRDIISDFCQKKNRYDQAFFIYMNYPDIWDRACRYVPIDSLPHRYWTRFNGLPRRKPNTDADSLRALGQSRSDYYMSKQIRGKRYVVEHSERTESDHCFYVFLSDYANNYESWEGDSDMLTCRNESRPISMVLAYDETFGTLDTHAHGGHEIAEALNASFCRVILNQEMTSSRSIKSAFRIAHLVLRENMLKAFPEIGVMKATLTSAEFVTRENGKRHTTKLSIDKRTQDNGDMFNRIEQCFPKMGDNTRVRAVQIILELVVSGIHREMSIELSNNSCSLRSNSEELRLLGEEFLKRSGIDEQPELF